MTIRLSPDLEVDIETIDVGSIHVIVELQTVLLVGWDISRHQSCTVIEASRTRTLNEHVPALCCKHNRIAEFSFKNFFGQLKYNLGVMILFAIQ